MIFRQFLIYNRWFLIYYICIYIYIISWLCVISCDVNIKIYFLHIALVINVQEDISKLQYHEKVY